MKGLTYIYICLLLVCLSACKKLVEIEPPRTSLTADAVFSNNESAIAAVTQLYATASGSNLYQASFLSLSSLPGLSADELMVYTSTNAQLLEFNSNSLAALTANSSLFQFWNNFYRNYVYNSNRIIEALNDQKSSSEDKDSKLSAKVKQHLLGEAQFIRAFSYFYLVQCYGDVPLLTTSDYITNSIAQRTSKNLVYQQIIKDLKDAENNLPDAYLLGDLSTASPSSPRIRPIKWAAKSLLARVYLYMDNYSEAEAQSEAVINHSSLYSLTTLDNVFKANSAETIWQIQPVTLGRNTQEGWAFNVGAGFNNERNFYLNPTILSAFEAGDQRRTSWVSSIIVNGITYYFPYKYKSAKLNDPVTEYSTVLRLSEQYLICAEARTNLGNIDGAKAMLNVIRKRAGLGNTNANTKDGLLDAILAERRVELFSEFGHRWFDLKRTGKIDAIMTLATPLKGGRSWQPYQAYYPIMPSQIDLNKNLTQTPGY